ncbi:hypothetical protein ACQ4PT_005251 [Festuca glaucescens]
MGGGSSSGRRANGSSEKRSMAASGGADRQGQYVSEENEDDGVRTWQGEGPRCRSALPWSFAGEGLQRRRAVAQWLWAQRASEKLQMAKNWCAEKNQMVKYGLRPRTQKGASEVEQLIFSTLSSDITLFKKIAPSAYRLHVDPRIKGKEDPRSDTGDSGTVDDNGDASSSGDESVGPQELSFPEHESRIVRGKKTMNKYSAAYGVYMAVSSNLR